MDAPGIREELRDMARRLASVGYYVMLPNLYYRSGVMELSALGLDDRDAFLARMFELMGSLTMPMIMEDTDALLAYAGSGTDADIRRVGCVGYCMSGQYSINAAARHPTTVLAAASIYGVRLVTDQPDSPHLAPARSGAELYFACAETDHWAPPEMVAALRKAMDGANAEVELYPGVEHGFAFPQRPAYDRAAAERHWERLFSLFRRRLAA
jgi:carboxymethylenebutenolidase